MGGAARGDGLGRQGMSRHRRVEEASDDGLDTVARLGELETALKETLAEVELGRERRTYPWDAASHGRHARPVVVDLRDHPDDHPVPGEPSGAVTDAAEAGQRR
jgi:hypothetical protein